MIISIKRFFENQLKFQSTETPALKNHRLQLASAALMIELLKTDRHIDERETSAVKRLLLSTFSLNHEELDQVIKLAEREVNEAVSLYEFTSLINEAYSYEDKLLQFEKMWSVELADDHLDKYEEQLIRKTADLIYISHSDFIKCKLKVRDKLKAGLPHA
jgi:uncharacterized tellurite resistance protein B-like protein